MKKLLFTSLIIFFMVAGGCKTSLMEDYTLQEKCAQDAKKRYEEESFQYGSYTYYYAKSSEAYLKSLKDSGKLKTIGDFEAMKDKVEEIHFSFAYQNHYNRKLNRCFMHVWPDLYPDQELKYSQLGEAEEYLIDVNEKQRYGVIEIVTSVVLDPKHTCYVSEKKCIQISEWRALIKPYMEE
jgi:hypothetical protein